MINSLDTDYVGAPIYAPLMLADEESNIKMTYLAARDILSEEISANPNCKIAVVAKKLVYEGRASVELAAFDTDQCTILGMAILAVQNKDTTDQLLLSQLEDMFSPFEEILFAKETMTFLFKEQA